MKLRTIQSAKPLPASRVKLVWDGGTESVVDLGPVLAKGGVFAFLTDPAAFNAAAVGGSYMAPFGLMSSGQKTALTFRRHMHVYGTPAEALGHIAVTFREHAQRNPAEIAAENPSQVAMLDVLETQLRALPPEQQGPFVQRLARDSGIDLELFALQDIAGDDILASLARGAVTVMNAADDQRWMLKQVGGAEAVLAFRYTTHEQRRSALDWTLAFIFYAAIALVIMTWLWPLRRDLERLEHATSTFGNRNWAFNADIGTELTPAVELRPVPEAVTSQVPQTKGYQYAVADNRVLLVSPPTRIVVGVFPDSKGDRGR